MNAPRVYSDGKPSRPNMNSVKIIFYLSILGALVSIYLIQEHYESQGSICDLSSRISCSKINKSSFSVLFSVPIAIFGLLWYFVIMVMSWNIWADNRDSFVWITLQFLWTISGIIFVIYLVIAEVIVGALCPFCTVVHIIVITQFILAYQMFKQQKTLPTIHTMLNTLQYWTVIFAFLFMIPIAYFNMNMLQGDVSPKNVDPFAKCLTREGVGMYGSNSCTFCMRQKSLFGASFEYINYVDCEETMNRETCDLFNINAYPVWIKANAQGKEVARLEGMRTFSELAETFGCTAHLDKQ